MENIEEKNIQNIDEQKSNNLDLAENNEKPINSKADESLGINVKKEEKKDKIIKIIVKVFVYLFLTLVAIFSILPFYWMIISSLKTETEYRQSVPTFFPQTIAWSNYSTVISSDDGLFGQMLVNTLVVGILSTTLGIAMIIITAFAFAKMNFKGKNIVFTLLLATMMIPGELYTITNYVTVSKAGWTNSYTVLILPFLVSVYYIYLLRNTFMQIPNSLYQAAKVDGTSDFKFLIKVMIPLSGPTIFSIFLLKFIGTWNSYIWPRLVNKKDEWKLLSNWVSQGFSLPGTSETSSTLKMAAATLVTIPLLVLFLCFRKYIMRGVSRSGTKG